MKPVAEFRVDFARVVIKDLAWGPAVEHLEVTILLGKKWSIDI